MGGMEVLYHMIFTRILTITFTKGRKDFSFRHSSAADSSTVDSSAADSSTVDDYSCKDTFPFVSQIKNASLSKKFLVSYDVTSLFTNIPLQETIDIATNLIFNHNSNLNITKKELKKLFLFATSQTHFIFNSTFYNQIDGVALGSPLAPVLANIFMCFYESKWLNEYNLNKPKFYLRYVDDILAAFDKEQD